MKLWRTLLILAIGAALTACGSHKKSAITSEEYILLELSDQLPGGEPPSSHAKAIVAEAYKWIGTPYRYGGNSRSGTDCSGLVLQVYLKAANKKLPRSSRQQAEYCKKISTKQMRPGDLIFFVIGKRSAIDHVGIYVGSGKMIHASGSRGVIESNLAEPYYQRHFHHAGRVP